MGLLLQGSLLLLLMLCVHGDYDVIVRIYNYTNPTNTGAFRGPSNCCDNNRQAGDVCSTTNRRCDNIFTFCVKMLNDSADGTSSCMSDLMTSETNWNDAPIDFTMSTWLGLDNPLRLTGITTAWQGAQVYIEVHDYDGNNNPIQLVDRWREHPNITAGAALSPPFNYNGIHGYGNLNMSFRVECGQYYYGVLCETLDECLSEPIDCNQGSCVDGEGSGTCVCNHGYTGQFCETEIDECADVNCSGSGVCVDGLGSFLCNCTLGYTGQFCETEINECEVLNINCNENEQCMDELNSYSCVCEPGYTGADCETNIDDCENRNCSGNGVCVDGVNSFSCECMSGFTGEMCSITAAPAALGSALIGGVVGGLLVMLILVLLLVVVMVCVWRRAHDQGKTSQDTHSQGDTISYIPGDNPVYGITENRTNRTNTITSETAEFDNPIYGSQGSLNDAELINPIYGDADFEDVLYTAVSDYVTPVAPVYDYVQNI